MVICPRCQQPVDETTRTTCPLCASPLPTTGGVAPLTAGVAPLSDAAAPLTPSGSGIPGLSSLTPPPSNMPLSGPTPAANQRMTLGGEIIEAPQPMSSKPGPGNSQYAARPGYVTPRTPPKAERASIDFKPILLGLVLLIGGGGGGWYYWMHRTNPKDQAQRFFTAVKEENFASMYETLEVDGAKYKDEQDYVDKTKSEWSNDPDKKAAISSLLSGLQFEAGEPKYASMTEATVPVSVTGSISVPFLGQMKAQEVKTTTDVKMKNFNGIWKVPQDSPLLSLLKGSASGFK